MTPQATLLKGSDSMILHEKRVRRARVSSKRQTTIPKDFYDILNFGDEVIIELSTKDRALIIRPAESQEVDFSADILRDLVQLGYSGEELIAKFEEVKADIPNALARMEEEAMNNEAVAVEDLEAYFDNLEDDEDDEDDEDWL